MQVLGFRPSVRPPPRAGRQAPANALQSLCVGLVDLGVGFSVQGTRRGCQPTEDGRPVPFPTPADSAMILPSIPTAARCPLAHAPLPAPDSAADAVRRSASIRLDGGGAKLGD